VLDPDLFDGHKYTIDSFYESHRRYFDRPAEFFQTFRSSGTIDLRDGIHPNEQIVRDGVFQKMLFETPVRTEWPENNTVPFKWFTDRAKPSKTILLFIPGWGRSSQSFEEQMAERLLKMGVDVGLLTKPFHQARTPSGSYSGEYFISANVFWTIANFRQLVAEIRLLIQYMRAHYDHIGLLGMSSGGFQAGLAANCENVDFLFSLITGCHLGSITWNGRLTQYVRRDLERRGVNEQDLTKAWSITDQAVLGHNCRARYRKHYISLFDTVVPTEYQIKLWEVYGKSDRRDLRSSHYSVYFLLNSVVDDIGTFIKRCGG
jgi:hypothetical protein